MAMRWATKNLISAVDGKAKAALLQGPFLRSPFKFYVRNLCDRMAAADADVDAPPPRVYPPTRNRRNRAPRVYDTIILPQGTQLILPRPTRNRRNREFHKSLFLRDDSSTGGNRVLPPGDEIVLECAQFAVQQRNNDRKGAQFKLVDVWRARSYLCAGSMYTMTIVASDASGSVNQFIVKVRRRPWMKPKPMDLLLWRRVSASKMLSKKEEAWDPLADDESEEESSISAVN